MSNPKVELHITGKGVVTLELDAAKAPKSVANFLAYVNKGHYNNTVFHRVIPGFMVQGGGFEPGMKQKPTDAPVENEANNGLKNTKYTVAMARTQAPHSASAQFFINASDNGFLNHTAESKADMFDDCVGHNPIASSFPTCRETLVITCAEGVAMDVQGRSACCKRFESRICTTISFFIATCAHAMMSVPVETLMHSKARCKYVNMRGTT